MHCGAEKHRRFIKGALFSAHRMNAIIVSYRRSKRDVTTNQAIVKVEGITNRADAQKLVGKTASWKSVKAVIAGKVSSAHGNSGCIRVHFERGLPGQAVTQTVQLQ
jgi:large subunit ribosomal protein L35Ae